MDLKTWLETKWELSHSKRTIASDMAAAFGVNSRIFGSAMKTLGYDSIHSNRGNYYPFIKKEFESQKIKAVIKDPHKKNRKALVILGGDDHFGANLKLTNDKYVYTPEIYANIIRHFLHRLDETGIDFNWYNGQIEELVYINHGDCIEGVAIHKNQAYNLHPDYQTASKQSEGVIKYGFKPILDWGIKKFGKARCTVCIGNHETNGYDKSETDMKTFDIVKDLKHLGYDANCDETEEFWHYTDILGFGSMSTHGYQLSRADGYQNILVSNMRSMKIKYPEATMFSCGHWHSAVDRKIIESNGGLRQLDFWRTGSPKQGDRFGARVSKGARPKRDWFALVVCENIGVIESRGFRMELP